MKRLTILAAAAFMAACSHPIEVEVAENAGVDRIAESVEVAWAQIEFDGLTPDNVVVKHRGTEIPSQVLTVDGEPISLLFQADVKAGGSETYQIVKGKRSAYAPLVYGRFVPERFDDYAWENDKAAFRAYGPALETAPGEMLATPGFDAWVKCVDTLVIDARYKRGNYHHNYGDGMDCYKVGRTLGAGASAPYAADTIWLSRNFAEFEILANGPLRTLVAFVYEPFEVDGTPVSLTKFIALDAHSHFNHIVNIYEGNFDTMPVVAGFIRHDVKGTAQGDGWIAMYEAASDSANPEEDGDLYFAVIQDDAQMCENISGHLAALREVGNGEPVEYLAGTGWSGAGIENLDVWTQIVEREAAAYRYPLTVTVR
ncbi:MAG: DUF4861 family protein [Alistipes sp.]|nr:DUF4861 family protein [Alistipes sp.]